MSRSWVIAPSCVLRVSNAGRKPQKPAFAQLIGVERPGNPSAAQDDRTVASLDDFLGFRRNQKDRRSLTRQLCPDALDLGPGSDVDAARRVDQQQDAGVGGKPARDLNLLLIAPAERSDRPSMSPALM